MAKEGLPFGAKSIEELDAREAAKAGNVTPSAPEPVPTEPQVEPAKGTPAKEETKAEPTKTSWIDEVNKTYGLDYKSADDFKAVLERAKKVDEYEPKFKSYEESESKYKKQIEDLQSSLNPLSYFSSQESFIAEQLRRQYPDKSPLILQEVVTSDSKKMSDLDVLIKSQMLDTPDLIGGEAGARDYIIDKYGIDHDTPQEEWSVTTRNKIKIEANQKRKEWEELKSKVQLPKVMTAEEKEAQAKALKDEKLNKVKPLKESFAKFDKFTEKVDDNTIFEFNVPDEYKQEAATMVESFFVDAGLDVTEENVATINKLVRAMLLENHFKQIYKTIEGDVETRMRAERDKLLNNTTPGNTRTATESETEQQKFSKEYGLGKLFSKK
jgi:hypothetical protein